MVCGRIDVEGLAGIRDQLWAEAKSRFESGSVWWLDTPDLVQLASDQQEARYEGDPWEEVNGPWLESRQSAAISEVLEKCLSKPQGQWTQTDKIRAARCLRAQGWLRYRERQGDRLEWRYREVDLRCSQAFPVWPNEFIMFSAFCFSAITHMDAVPSLLPYIQPPGTLGTPLRKQKLDADFPWNRTRNTGNTPVERVIAT